MGKQKMIIEDQIDDQDDEQSPAEERMNHPADIQKKINTDKAVYRFKSAGVNPFGSHQINAQISKETRHQKKKQEGQLSKKPFQLRSQYVYGERNHEQLHEIHMNKQ